MKSHTKQKVPTPSPIISSFCKDAQSRAETNSDGWKAHTAVTAGMIDEKMLLEGEKENEYLLME